MRDALRVAYVVGSGHSGSTLLAMLADEHPQVASVGETAVKPRIRREGRAAIQPCSCGVAISECRFWQRIFERVSADGIRFDATCWSNDYRFENWWLDLLLTRETSVWPLLTARRLIARHTPPYRARVARIDRANVALVRAVLAQTGASVFFDATKLLTRLTYLLNVPEFDVSVVQLVRDVRGVAGSAKGRDQSVVAAAQTWHKDQCAIARLLEQLSPQRTLLVRYEDLCAQPQTTLQRLWAFCGVEPFDTCANLRSSDHHILGNRMRMAGTISVRADESWRTRLTAAEQRQVLDLAGDTNRRLGYS